MDENFMRFLRSKKTVITKGDICTVKVQGIKNLPQIVIENNEVMYIGEFKKDFDTIAICSSIFVSELLFIQKDLLEKNKKQPTILEKMLLIQMDSIVALKEISFHLKGYQKIDSPNVSVPTEEDINYN